MNVQSRLETGHEPVVIALGNRVVFMVVTAGALEIHAEQTGRDGLHDSEEDVVAFFDTNGRVIAVVFNLS